MVHIECVSEQVSPLFPPMGSVVLQRCMYLLGLANSTYMYCMYADGKSRRSAHTQTRNKIVHKVMLDVTRSSKSRCSSPSNFNTEYLCKYCILCISHFAGMGVAGV